MTIFRLDAGVARAMINELGGDIFRSKTDDGENTVTVTLSEYAILKCYGYDGTVIVDLGAKIFILERNNYWRIELK